MMSKIKIVSRHVNHYIPLVGIILSGSLGIIHFSYDRMFQASLAVAVAFSYFVWGVIHHYLHQDLDVSILVEYLAIATLGLMIVLSVLFRF
ncbi:hypothetical protein IPM62_04885 [Candidatus Woesebacteria bacterium]|nr:MAG: hypothetical protein IPM62_04885 [Candidatus Woesebacteria bacterium]